MDSGAEDPNTPSRRKYNGDRDVPMGYHLVVALALRNFSVPVPIPKIYAFIEKHFSNCLSQFPEVWQKQVRTKVSTNKDWFGGVGRANKRRSKGTPGKLWFFKKEAEDDFMRKFNVAMDKLQDKESWLVNPADFEAMVKGEMRPPKDNEELEEETDEEDEEEIPEAKNDKNDTEKEVPNTDESQQEQPKEAPKEVAAPKVIKDNYTRRIPQTRKNVRPIQIPFSQLRLLKLQQAAASNSTNPTEPATSSLSTPPPLKVAKDEPNQESPESIYDRLKSGSGRRIRKPARFSGDQVAKTPTKGENEADAAPKEAESEHAEPIKDSNTNPEAEISTPSPLKITTSPSKRRSQRTPAAKHVNCQCHKGPQQPDETLEEDDEMADEHGMLMSFRKLPTAAKFTSGEKVLNQNRYTGRKYTTEEIRSGMCKVCFEYQENNKPRRGKLPPKKSKVFYEKKAPRAKCATPGSSVAELWETLIGPLTLKKTALTLPRLEQLKKKIPPSPLRGIVKVEKQPEPAAEDPPFQAPEAIVQPQLVPNTPSAGPTAQLPPTAGPPTKRVSRPPRTRSEAINKQQGLPNSNSDNEIPAPVAPEQLATPSQGVVSTKRKFQNCVKRSRLEEEARLAAFQEQEELFALMQESYGDAYGNTMPSYLRNQNNDIPPAQQGPSQPWSIWIPEEKYVPLPPEIELLKPLTPLASAEENLARVNKCIEDADMAMKKFRDSAMCIAGEWTKRTAMGDFDVARVLGERMLEVQAAVKKFSHNKDDFVHYFTTVE